MNFTELVIWSGMAGGLLTLALLALLYALYSRNLGSLRYLLFVAVTGASSLVRTGLPEALFPTLPLGLLWMAKICAGPLSAALTLHFLGLWLGGPQEDPLAWRLTGWGSRFFLLTALVLGVLVLQAGSDAELRSLLQVTAWLTVLAVMLGLGIALRAAALGDPLAPWVVLAGVCLAIEIFGLGVYSLQVPGYGLGTWALTAVCTVLYFLVGSVVVVKRIRQNRQLERLAALETRTDATTGLPVGSVLLGEVTHAFWRTARLGGICTVVCLHIRNLYEDGDGAQYGVEQQIQAAMAARIRRAAGFRCVVGLYHPGCFVVVISADKRHQYVHITVSRLRSLVGQLLNVVGRDGVVREFQPRLGVGVLTVDPATASPMEAIHDAERQALGPPRGRVESEDHIVTMPSESLTNTRPAPL
ncbi:MAG: hypothetical protein ACK4F4_13070 [Hylemonella sp.]|uniref:hypothetical protein n=1 Tax=Hylemonella sp. TaxID=2066020 RepID=UPI00391C5480